MRTRQEDEKREQMMVESSAPLVQTTARRATNTEIITVVYTRMNATLSALRFAHDIASDSAATLRVMVPHVVPYPLPLERPDMSPLWSVRALTSSALENGYDLTIDVRLCRDPLEAIACALQPGSTILIGDSGSWWRSYEKSLAKRLSRKGYRCLLVAGRQSGTPLPASLFTAEPPDHAERSRVLGPRGR